MKQPIQHGQKQQRERRRRGETADDHRGKGPRRLGADTLREGRRQQAECRHERRHHDWAQTLMGPGTHGVLDRPPAWRSSLKRLARITPFCTEIPNSAMNPTAAETLKLMLRSHSDRMPPMSANGRLARIKAAYLVESNAANSRMKMITMLVGTMIASRVMARR